MKVLNKYVKNFKKFKIIIDITYKEENIIKNRKLIVK